MGRRQKVLKAMKIWEGIHGQLIGIFKTLFSYPFCLKNLLTGLPAGRQVWSNTFSNLL
jgi:hypothetical protein